MKKKSIALTQQNDLSVDLTFHGVSACLVGDFVEKIVKPYYGGNLNVAFQDLVHKVIAEQDFVLSHITHIRNSARAAGCG